MDVLIKQALEMLDIDLPSLLTFCGGNRVQLCDRIHHSQALDISCLFKTNV